MLSNFKKSILSQKRQVLIVLLFCTLFSLFFPAVSFASADEEFTQLENKLKEKTLKPDEFLESITRVYIKSYSYEKNSFVVNDLLLKRRNELVSLGLTSDANVNKFLGMVVSRQPDNSDDLINIALAQGAKFSDMKIEYLGGLPSLELAKQILGSSFDPNKFLELVIQAGLASYNSEKNAFEVSNDLIKRRNELVELAFGYVGADKNKFLGMVISRQLANQEDLINIALAKGAKFSDIKIEYLSSLSSPELAEQILDSSFDPNKFLELIVQANVNSSNNEKGVYGVDNDLIKRRNELVELAFGYAGADKNKFLGMVISRQLANQEDLINIALAKGAKFSDIKIEYLSSLPSPELAEQILDSSFDPNKFLELIVQANVNSSNNEKGVYGVDNDLIKRRNELVELAFGYAGADKNKFLGMVISRQLANQEDLINIALAKGAKFSDIKIEYLSSLPSLELAEQILDSSFDPNKFLELIVQVNVSSGNNEKGVYGVDNDLIKRRNELVDLVLGYAGADKNKFLGMVISRQLANQEDLIKLALAKGAKFSDIKIEYLSSLPSLELAMQMLDNSFDPTSFLSLILDIHYTFDYSEFLSKQTELVILALKKGADPNRLIQIDGLDDLDLNMMHINPKTLELLFNNEYKKIDPDLFCKYLEFMQSEKSKEVRYSLDSKYKNLAAKAGLVPRIPRVLHQIWVTNSKRRREISAEDMQHILDAEKVFLQSGQKWEHIVWTNDKSLIPISVEKLESSGIKVREMSEIEDYLKRGKQVRELIEQEDWGMASDLLRYDIVYYMGGVYADVNFVFTRDVEPEIYKYDFFNHSVYGFYMENSFFGAKANHPILGETLNLVDDNFNHPSKRLIALRQTKSRRVTDITTYAPFNTAYYKAANNGTIDVMYPAHRKEPPDQNYGYVHDNNICIADSVDVIKKYTNCGECLNFYKDQKKLYEYREDRDICGTEQHVYGSDIGAGSWINKESNLSESVQGNNTSISSEQ